MSIYMLRKNVQCHKKHVTKTNTETIDYETTGVRQQSHEQVRLIACDILFTLKFSGTSWRETFTSLKSQVKV